MDTATIDYYDAHARAIATRYREADVSHLHHVLRRGLPPQGRVLEIGCGSGRDTLLMASLSLEVLAVDASRGMVAEAARYIDQHGASGNAVVLEAGFPLNQGHPVGQERFDAVISIAVLMHIPDQELFECAYQIRGLIRENGLFICSFPANRQQVQGDSRLCVPREPGAVSLLFERLGLRLLASEDNPDGLGRDQVWTTLVFTAEGSGGGRPVDQIESIINRDRKTATYKLALFRALCELAQSSYHCAHFLPQDRVGIPLGMVVEQWLYSYWPLVDTDLDLPEMRIGKRAKGMAFRAHLESLVHRFSPGGLDAFYALFQNGQLSGEQARWLTLTVTSRAGTIIKGPVTYAGGSLNQEEPIFSYEGRQRISQCSSALDLSRGLGEITFPAGLWREMCLVGHWIGEAIIMRWAQLSRSLTRNEVPLTAILGRLMVRPESERQVFQARTIYLDLADLCCVWSGRLLTATRCDVDHLIPFAFWHHNDRWNLMPADARINRQKRDRIIQYWQMLYREAPTRFRTELGQRLLGSDLPPKNRVSAVLTTLFKVVETVACQRGIERWSISSL